MNWYQQGIYYGLITQVLFTVSLALEHSAKGMEQVAEIPVARNFPLHDAARAGNVEWVKELVQQGKIIAMPDQNGDTPLHCAAEAGKIEAINCLIDLGANLGALNLAGYTPLMKAKSPEIVALLRHRGARDQVFVKPEALKMVRMLVRVQQEDGNNPLHWASRNGLVDVVKAFLAMGIDKNVRDSDNHSPLHMAANGDVVRVLLAAGADKEAWGRSGSRPLHFAASADVANALLTAGANIEAKDDFGRSPLHNAGNRIGVVEALLVAGADKESQDNDGCRPLHGAALNRQIGVVEILLMARADKEAQRKDGDRPLHIAAACGHETVVEALLKAQADKEALGKDGHGPLHNAVIGGRVEAVKVLLANGANKQCRLSADDRRFPNMTLYEIALKQLTEFEKRGEPDFLLANFENIIELLSEPVADNDPSKSAELLLRPSRRKKTENRRLNNYLLEASAKGEWQKVEALITEGADKDAQQGDGSSALHLAAHGGHVEVIKVLLAAGADKDPENIYGSRPLDRAVFAGHIDVVKTLLAAGAKKQIKNLYDGNTALHSAAGVGHVELVELLLAEGADKEAEDNLRSRSLHKAAQAGRLEVVQILLKVGAEIDAQDWLGNTPLHLAAEEGHRAVVESFLNAGAQIEAQDKRGARPLHRAVIKGRVDVVKALLEKGASKQNRTNNNGNGFPWPNMTPCEIAQKQFDKSDDLGSKDAFKKIIELLSEQPLNDSSMQLEQPTSLGSQVAKEEKSSVLDVVAANDAIPQVESKGERRWLMRPDYLLRKEVASATDSAQRKKALLNLLDHSIGQADSAKIAECAAELNLPAESSRILAGYAKGEEESPFMYPAEIEKMVQESNDLNLRAELWLRLADIYYFNIRNYARACENYEKAANQSINLVIQAIALVRLGELFSINHVNYETAESYLLRAAQQSASLEMQALAWLRLAWIYYFHKEGTTVNIKQAVYYFELAAAQIVNTEVHVAANIMLGSLHYHGRIFNDIPVDKVKARIHYERVAAQNQNLEAQELAMRRLEEISSDSAVKPDSSGSLVS